MGHVGIPSTEVYRWCNPIRLVVDKQGFFAFSCSKFSVMSKFFFILRYFKVSTGNLEPARSQPQELLVRRR